MKKILIILISFSIIFIDKDYLISKDKIIGKWVEIGRLCDIKGICKEIPVIPQEFDFKSNGVVYVDDIKMYYYIDNRSILKISDKKNSNEYVMDSAFYFLSENILLIESDFNIGDEKVYYKYTKQ